MGGVAKVVAKDCHFELPSEVSKAETWHCFWVHCFLVQVTKTTQCIERRGEETRRDETRRDEGEETRGEARRSNLSRRGSGCCRGHLCYSHGKVFGWLDRHHKRRKPPKLPRICDILNPPGILWNIR